jgi:hypothetical protein
MAHTHYVQGERFILKADKLFSSSVKKMYLQNSVELYTTLEHWFRERKSSPKAHQYINVHIHSAYITMGMVRAIFLYQLFIKHSIFRYGAYFSNT